MEAPELTASSEYLKLCGEGKIDGVEINDRSYIYMGLDRLCSCLNISVRQLKRLMQEIFAIEFNSADSRYAGLITDLAYLKLYNTTLFNKINNNTAVGRIFVMD